MLPQMMPMPWLFILFYMFIAMCFVGFSFHFLNIDYKFIIKKEFLYSVSFFSW